MAPAEKTKAYVGKKEVDAGLLAEFHQLADPRVAILLDRRTHPEKLMTAKRE